MADDKILRDTIILLVCVFAVIAACAIVMRFAVLDRRAEQPAIDTAELTGWFKLEGR